MADPYGYPNYPPPYPPRCDSPPSFPPRCDYPPPFPPRCDYPYPPVPPASAPPPPPYAPYRPTYPDNHVRTAYHWVDSSPHHGVPSTALHGGVDIDGHQIYVGRAFFDGDWIPAKVIPGKRVAYVAYNGREHVVDRYQVLCEQRFDWVPCHKDHIPPGAVEGGRTKDGEPLYIGRVHHRGSMTVGKVHPSHRTCYIPFDGEEMGFKDYEVLVLRS